MGICMSNSSTEARSNMKTSKWILATAFDGAPKLSNFKLVEENLPELRQGEVLIQATYLSLDPYMRIEKLTNMKVGDTVVGQQVAKVVSSKDPNYPVGQEVLAAIGWRAHTIINPSKNNIILFNPEIEKLPDLGELPSYLALSVLGMTGATAYFGLLRVCEPKAGETVLVSSAAGAVGSIVGQIAKIKGCKVIGSAGTEEKCKWLKEELGFDYVFNYKTSDLSESLKKGAPEGIDCYFDNVGGKFTTTVIMDHMKPMGRIAVCGSLSEYNVKPGAEKGPYPWKTFLEKLLTMRGFLFGSYKSEFSTFITDAKKWIAEGKIHHNEDITKGFSNTPAAFIRIFTGGNTGKAIVEA